MSLRETAREARAVQTFVWTHPANQGRRLRALGRAALFQARGRLLGKATRVRIGTHSWLLAEIHMTGASKAVYGNPPDHPEMLVWKDHIKPGSLFVDVGANVGSYSIWAADLGAEVIALEPIPATFRALQGNIALNGYPINAIQAAAGAHPGTARFTSDLGTTNRADPNGDVTVDVVTLDDLIGDRQVDGMKVDVEGFEIDVLAGARRTLQRRQIRLLQLEWNSCSSTAVGADREDVAELLRKSGYSLYRPDGSGRLISTSNVSYGPDMFARAPRDREAQGFGS